MNFVCQASINPIARRWRAVLLLCGWLAATGAHWDLIQVAAWGKMWIENSRTASVGDALATTFSPEGMCSICHAVQAAQHAQPDDDMVLAKLADKAPLLLASTMRPIIAAPGVSHWISARPSPMPRKMSHRPPVPPPRLEPIAC